MFAKYFASFVFKLGRFIIALFLGTLFLEFLKLLFDQGPFLPRSFVFTIPLFPILFNEVRFLAVFNVILVFLGFFVDIGDTFDDIPFIGRLFKVRLFTGPRCSSTSILPLLEFG
jgi:hypothetical protein